MKIVLLAEAREKQYAFKLSNMFGSADVRIITQPVTLVTKLREYCKTNNIDAVCSTQLLINRKIANEPDATIGSLAGSIYKMPMSLEFADLDCVDFLCLNELKLLNTQAYQPFLTQRYISKLTHPKKWLVPNKFEYEVIDHTQGAKLLKEFDSSMLVAVDIETDRPLEGGFACMSCCGYTTVHMHGDELVLNNYVLPIDSLDAVKLMRRLNSHKVRKCLQSGKYDSAYFYAYSAPLTNYTLDTVNMHHSWYSELPKDLATLAAFYVRYYNSWKGSVFGKTREQLYKYNAKDTYYTALVAIAWLLESPKWAKDNYISEFPLVFPSHLAEMTGMAVDVDRFKEVKLLKEANIEKLSKKLDTMLGVTNFNVNSYPQVRQLLKILTNKNHKTSDKTELQRVADEHPLNAVIIEAITEIRSERKLVSSYLKQSMMLTNPLVIKGKPRLVYALNPHGTDTGRLASNSHHFWAGLNIQNIPREGTIKSVCVADDGFAFCEADYAQAESRGTGYITGEMALIEATESDRDFHKSNASMFFGVPYADVNKPLRQLSKPVNHGANYNMGANTLIAQMGGTLAVMRAGKLLGLPPNYTTLDIANHLLMSFDRTYPKIRNQYHKAIKSQVLATRKLTGATGWTRYCFGNPVNNRLALNSYIAHCPQSLNAMMLNKAVLSVFKNVWLPNHKNFLFITQIHDSILFQYRIGHEHLIEDVQECMYVPIDVPDITGTVRTLIVPTDVKHGASNWSGT